ncbi:hypothetical protein [Corynebacterium sp. HMSC071F07]|nr:hypothetical protein [Corynebacterium sp. HMSC071F07]
MMTELAVRANEDVFSETLVKSAEALEAAESAEIIAAYRGITEPGMRRAFVEAARRFGEVFRREELEMWALQEENR